MMFLSKTPMIPIFIKLENLKSDRGSSPLRLPLDPPLAASTSFYGRLFDTKLNQRRLAAVFQTKAVSQKHPSICIIVTVA